MSVHSPFIGSSDPTNADYSDLKRFHFNPETGVVGKCNATKGNCPFGDVSTHHYPSEALARNAFERLMERETSVQIDPPGQASPIRDEFIWQGGKHPDRDETVYQLPAGSYLLCDPFVLIGTQDQEGWNNWVKTVEETTGLGDNFRPDQDDVTTLAAMYDDFPIIATKNWYGDGTMFSLAPTGYVPTDSGLVAPIPMSLIEKFGKNSASSMNRLGLYRVFQKPFQIYRNFSGEIYYTYDIEDDMEVPNVILADMTLISKNNMDALMKKHSTYLTMSDVEKMEDAPTMDWVHKLNTWGQEAANKYHKSQLDYAAGKN